MFTWQILILLSSFVVLASGFEEGARAGGAGIWIGIVVGLFVAIVSWFGLGVFGLFVAKRARLGASPMTRWQAPVYLFMYVYPAAWAFVARLLVIYITRFLIHHVAA
jgi:hypothetical protein